MPNGEGKPWTPRRPNNDQLWKLLGLVFVPAIGWLLITVIAHSQELSARAVQVEASAEQQEQAEGERHEIAKQVERVEERVNNYQRANDSAHLRQERKLDRILEKIEVR